jgi:hypothetical protein
MVLHSGRLQSCLQIFDCKYLTCLKQLPRYKCSSLCSWIAKSNISFQHVIKWGKFTKLWRCFLQCLNKKPRVFILVKCFQASLILWVRTWAYSYRVGTVWCSTQVGFCHACKYLTANIWLARKKLLRCKCSSLCSWSDKINISFQLIIKCGKVKMSLRIFLHCFNKIS